MRKPIRTFIYGLCILLLLQIIAVLFFPAPVLRLVIAQFASQARISFDKAYWQFDGEFGSYSLALAGIAFQRQDHHILNFDLTAQNANIAVPFCRSIRIQGLRGTVDRAGLPDENGNAHNHSRKMSLDSLTLADVQIVFTDRTPERPFQAAVAIEHFNLERPLDGDLGYASLLAPYRCRSEGQIETSPFRIQSINQESRQLGINEVPITLFAPYAPIIDSIFVAGRMQIHVDDLSDDTRNKLRISVRLWPDCQLKPADEILAPALQAALEHLDNDALPALLELRDRVGRLRTNTESIRADLDRVTEILDALRMLAPRDVRQRYDRFKAQYDRARADYDEWNSQLDTLVLELDQVKVRAVEETFRRFIESGNPLVIEIQETDGNWEADIDAMVIQLIEENYIIIILEFQERIRELRDAVDRLVNGI